MFFIRILLLTTIATTAVRAAPPYYSFEDYNNDQVPFDSDDDLDIPSDLGASLMGLVFLMQNSENPEKPEGDMKVLFAFFGGKKESSSNVLKGMVNKIESALNIKGANNEETMDQLKAAFKNVKY